MTRLEASEPTGKPSGLSDRKPGPKSAEYIEEVEILLKLGATRQAEQKLEQFLTRYPSNPRVLEVAVSFYLSKRDAPRAAVLLDKLEALAGSGPNIVLLRAEQARLNQDYPRAKKLYEKALENDKGSPWIRLAYAEVLAELREWDSSQGLYRELFEEGVQRPGIRRDYLRLLDKGSPRLSNLFSYRKAPSAQRIFVIEQKGSFWVSPWLRLGAAVGEEIYKKNPRDAAAGVNQFLMTQMFEAEAFIRRGLSVLPHWKTTYNDGGQSDELGGALKWQKGPLTHRTGYDWNHTARDPMEALGVQGRIDKLYSRTSWRFFDRFEPGHEASMEWFRMRGSDNAVNGAENLGHKFTSDAFADYTLFKNPQTVLSYHYRTGHWDQKFEGADGVIAYLADEQVHSGGLYVEQPVGDYLNAAASVTRASDLKRKTLSLIWSFKITALAGEYGKVDFSYEYITGDSGASGSGDSQSFAVGTALYF